MLASGGDNYLVSPCGRNFFGSVWKYGCCGRQVATEDHEGVETLKRLLRDTASTYRTLLEHAVAAGVDVPEEALLGTAAAGPRGPPPLKWNEHAASTAVDWEDFVDAGALGPRQLLY